MKYSKKKKSLNVVVDFGILKLTVESWKLVPLSVSVSRAQINLCMKSPALWLAATMRRRDEVVSAVSGRCWEQELFWCQLSLFPPRLPTRMLFLTPRPTQNQVVCSLTVWWETTLTLGVDTLKTCVFMHLLTLYGCEHSCYVCFVIHHSVFKRESIWDVLVTAGRYQFLWMFATD